VIPGKTSAARVKKDVDNEKKSSADEEDLEQAVHTDSAHVVRQKVLHRMEAQNMFASYSFVGLPELGQLCLYRVR